MFVLSSRGRFLWAGVINFMSVSVPEPWSLSALLSHSKQDPVSILLSQGPGSDHMGPGVA